MINNQEFDKYENPNQWNIISYTENCWNEIMCMWKNKAGNKQNLYYVSICYKEKYWMIKKMKYKDIGQK